MARRTATTKERGQAGLIWRQQRWSDTSHPSAASSSLPLVPVHTMHTLHPPSATTPLQHRLFLSCLCKSIFLLHVLSSHFAASPAMFAAAVVGVYVWLISELRFRTAIHRRGVNSLDVIARKGRGNGMSPRGPPLEDAAYMRMDVMLCCASAAGLSDAAPQHPANRTPVAHAGRAGGVSLLGDIVWELHQEPLMARKMWAMRAE